jgi:hypothetical protein
MKIEQHLDQRIIIIRLAAEYQRRQEQEKCLELKQSFQMMLLG